MRTFSYCDTSRHIWSWVYAQTSGDLSLWMPQVLRDAMPKVCVTSRGQVWVDRIWRWEELGVGLLKRARRVSFMCTPVKVLQSPCGLCQFVALITVQFPFDRHLVNGEGSETRGLLWTRIQRAEDAFGGKSAGWQCSSCLQGSKNLVHLQRLQLSCRGEHWRALFNASLPLITTGGVKSSTRYAWTGMVRNVNTHSQHEHRRSNPDTQVCIFIYG